MMNVMCITLLLYIPQNYNTTIIKLFNVNDIAIAVCYIRLPFVMYLN